MLDTAVVYPTYGERQKKEAIVTLAKLIRKHGVEHIAIGNGTASRETEQMAVELIHQVNETGAHVSYMIVSEAGASVYSASKLAAEELPQYDVSLRSAVCLARREQAGVDKYVHGRSLRRGAAQSGGAAASGSAPARLPQKSRSPAFGPARGAPKVRFTAFTGASAPKHGPAPALIVCYRPARSRVTAQ